MGFPRVFSKKWNSKKQGFPRVFSKKWNSKKQGFPYSLRKNTKSKVNYQRLKIVGFQFHQKQLASKQEAVVVPSIGVLECVCSPSTFVKSFSLKDILPIPISKIELAE